MEPPPEETEEDYFAAAYEEELMMEEEARGAQKAPRRATPRRWTRPSRARHGQAQGRLRLALRDDCCCVGARRAVRRFMMIARNKSCRRRAPPSRMMVSVCCDCRLRRTFHPGDAGGRFEEARGHCTIWDARNALFSTVPTRASLLREIDEDVVKVMRTWR